MTGKAKPQWDRPPWLSSAVVMCALVVTLLVAYTRIPTPPCLFRSLYGVPCPGCGLTHSLALIWRGDLLTSFRHHPLGVPVAVFGLVFLARGIWPAQWHSSRRVIDRICEVLISRPVMLAAGVLLISIWVMRLLLAALGHDFFIW